MSNVINEVIDTWDGERVRFSDRIYFTIVYTYEMSHQVLVQEYKKNSSHFGLVQ